MLSRRVTLALGAAVLARPVLGQEPDFPTRPVRIVVPYGAGGLTDVLARSVAEHLRQAWPQPVVVENTPGAGGNVGAAAVARAAPDGHTLLVAAPGPLAFNHVLFPRLTYDPTAFVPISILVRVPNVVVVGPSVTAPDLATLVAEARREPERFSYASNGPGSTPHLVAELFGSLAGTKLRHIPYSSEPQGLTDVVAGRVDLTFSNVGASSALVSAGRLRALAVADPVRSPRLPDVPTTREAGMEGLVSSAWFGMVAPPRTPPAIAERIGAAVRAALGAEATRRRLSDLGTDPLGTTPAEALAFAREEERRWGGVIRGAGITLE